jgi:hypothetical protein
MGPVCLGRAPGILRPLQVFRLSGSTRKAFVSLHRSILFPVDLVLFHVCYPVYFSSPSHVSPIFAFHSSVSVGIFRDWSPRKFSARVFIATRTSSAEAGSPFTSCIFLTGKLSTSFHW